MLSGLNVPNFNIEHFFEATSSDMNTIKFRSQLTELYVFYDKFKDNLQML